MKVAFTGNTLTGRKILKAAAESNLKNVTLELGGKSPTVIFDDAELEQAIKWAASGIFFNMGQACTAGSRIYVQEGIYDRFLQGFTKIAEGLAQATGGPFEKGVQHGPQVSNTQFEVRNKFLRLEAHSSKDVDLAVEAAGKAYKTVWGLKVPGAERGKLLGKLADLVEKHADEMAALEALNVGKQFPIARHVDIKSAVSTLRYYAGWADKIHGKTIERVMGYIKSGKADGAKVHIGGERHGDQGYFIKPTIFTDAKPNMKIMQEEIFGPVCSVVKFKTEEEVTEWANNTTYGLAANVLTQNISRAIRMAHNLEAGSIYVNSAQNEILPFRKGAITPWNFPLDLISWKIGPALATGNTVVLKPSETTPLTALFLADLINQAGFPPGVVNIVNGYGNTVGSAISSHPLIMKVAFTGSTLTGRKILKAAAESNLKNVTLELGGKSPTVIFDDADLEQAIKWAASGIFFNMGQACTAGSRIYVQEGIYDRFLQGFTKVAEGLAQATGGPFEKGVKHGPQVSNTQFERVMGYIKSGKADGAKVHIGGERHGDQGYFIKPTIFTDAKPNMKIMQEEIFGPVCSVVKFKIEEEVTEWANNTTYGLAANVLTQNISRAIRMAHNLEAGSIYVNSAQNGEINVPFGGYKQSGIGREKGQYALDNYTQVKAVHINIGRKL
ncbi:Aldehyde dehydrogenase [Leucoagaricus sp. SymC.cos]|nr:Aldehyde dehydrogenase [Leucoagaricus sp. SymC.cos]